MYFKLYILASFVLTFYAIYQSFELHKQFYPSLLYLSTNKINRTIIFNFALMLVTTIIILILRFMYGEIREMERIVNIIKYDQSVIDKMKRKTLEIIYLLAIFSDQLDWQFLFLIMGLIGLSIIHWVTVKRSTYMMTESQIHVGQHLKLITMFTLLFYIEIKISMNFFYSSELQFQDYLFAFEFLLLPIKLALPFIQYAINLFEVLTYSQFDSKATLFSFLDVLFTVLKLFVQSLLFFYLMQTQGFLLYLFVDLIDNFYGLLKQLKVLRNQIQLVRTIEKIQDVNQIDQNDNICLICLHDLDSGKKLSCGHIFHKSCIKTWIQGNPNQFCPKCKKPIQLDQQDDNSKLRRETIYQEFVQIRNSIAMTQIVQKFRTLQSQHQNSEGIGSVQYGLPCEAVYQMTPITELKRLQINQMNATIMRLEEGLIDE